MCKPTLLLTLLTLPVLAAAAASHFTLSEVMSAPFANSLTASRDGSKVAWVQNASGKRNIWVASAPAWKGQQVTSFDGDDGQEISDLAWAPNGTYLLFARGGDFENGGENPNPSVETKLPSQDIWYVAMDSSKPRKITAGKAPAISPNGDYAAFPKASEISFLKLPLDANTVADPKVVLHDKGTISSLVWSPDGKALAFVSVRNRHSFVGVYDPAGKTVRYLDASVDRDTSPRWSADSSRIAYIRIPSDAAGTPGPKREATPWSIRMTDIRTNNSSEVFQASTGAGSVFHPLASEEQLFFGPANIIIFPWERSGWCHLYSVSSGATPTELTPGEGEVENVSQSENGSNLYYASNISDIDRRHLWSLALTSNAKPVLMTPGETLDMSPVAVAGDAVAFLTASYNASIHAAVHFPDGTTNDLVPQSVPKEFPAAALVKPQAVMLTAADGLPIHAQLFLPPDYKAGEHRPALVFFHGGSRRQMLLGFHYMYYYSNAYSMNQYLANRGYIVLSVNYRSGIGYGLNFREALHYGVSGGSEYNDVVGAGMYLRARPDVDAKRIGVWGGSYGGYLTAMALAKASDLFAAGVDFHGVHDWSTLRGYGAAASGGDPKRIHDQQEFARIAFESSPMAYIDGWKSPVLLIHGDDDRNVEFQQTEQLVEGLRAHHVEFKQLIFPNEIHDFLMHKSWVTAYEAAAAFFDAKFAQPQPLPSSY